MWKLCPQFILCCLRKVDWFLKRLSALIKSTFRNYLVEPWCEPIFGNLHLNGFLLRFCLHILKKQGLVGEWLLWSLACVGVGTNYESRAMNEVWASQGREACVGTWGCWCGAGRVVATLMARCSQPRGTGQEGGKKPTDVSGKGQRWDLAHK